MTEIMETANERWLSGDELCEQFQMFRQAGNLIIAGHGIDGAVNPDAVAVGKSHSHRQFFGGEISRKGTHAEQRC